MSVLVPSLPSTHPHHQSHSSLFSTMNSTNPRRHHGPISTKSTENDPDSDHVPFGVVNSMKQRFLNKMNESFAFHPPPPPSSSSSSSHHSSTLTRTSLSKPSSRQPSNENLLQNKSITSPLKRTTRLSRSQDNLSNHHVPMVNEQFTSYLQPKQDLIIVDTSTSQENELFDGQKTALHRQSYTELHCDEAPKPGTVTTVKNMFERQIRLSRYDADKLLSNPPVSNGRSTCQHRDFPSPTRSRSMSPNDLAVRQRRTNLSNSTSSSTGLSLPVPTSYPDLVISHTPPTETSKPTVSHEPTYLNGHSTDFHSTATMISKEKKSLGSMRNSLIHEPPQPLTVIVDEHLPVPSTSSARPNLLLPSTVPSSESIDCQPLDFKSRLALFNRTNTQLNGEKKTPIVAATPSVTKPSVPHSNRPTIEEKKEPLVEPMNHHLLTMGIARSVVNTAKAVTFFGGSKLNSNQKSSLPNSIAPPPPPPAPSTSSSSTSQANPTDVFRAPDIIGGNIKLNKSSIYSGSKKDARVQFIENVDTFEYPSFEVAMAELGGVVSDEEKNGGNEDDDDDDGSTGSSTHEEEEMQLKSLLQEKLNQLSQSLEDVDDDELERLARINAKYNANDKSTLKPKGTLHTFRPTHLDQYELGTQHNSLSNGKSSDKTSSPANAYSILARQKLLQTSDNSVKNFSHHPMVKTNGHSSVKSTYDLPNTNPSTIQWSSMSTTTDLLF